MNNKHSTYIAQKTFFSASWDLIFGKKDQARILQINSNLYSVLGIILLKFQKDWSLRTKIIAWKHLYLQMDNNNEDRHNIIKKTICSPI
jgi:uncharacterized protein (DUF1919 family)